MTLQTATNPDTGERVALVDGEWKPITQSATNAEGTKAYLVGGSWVVDDRAAPTPKQEAKAEPKPAATEKEVDPRTGKPYPEAVALPEKDLWGKFKDLVSRNEVETLKARAANEAAARRTAAERGVPISQVYKESGGYRPTFNPEGREGIQASIEATTAAAKSTKETLPAAANTYLRAVRGGDIPVKDKSWLDRAITATKPEEKVVDKNVEAFANVGESIGFSAATMVASILAGAAASTVSSPIGGVAAGMATSGALSYSATKDQFLERVKEKLDKESVRLFERPLDEKEWEKAKKDYDSLATQYGAWEAIPEAVSNALMLKAFTAPLKYVNSAEKLSKIALRGAAGQVPEQLSETITALGQNAAELKAGLTKEEMGVADAFRAQFVQSLITAGVMNAGAKTVQASRDFYVKYVEPKVSPGSALGRAIQADIDATAFQASQPQRYTDTGKAAQPPQRRDVEAPVSQFPAPPTNLELEKTRNKAIETEPPTGLELEKTRKEGIETTPPAATPADPLTELLKARNQGIETEPPAVTPKAEPIPDEEVEAKIQALTQDFMVKGFAEDDARMLAEQVVSENRAGRVLERDVTADEQRTVEGKAERALLQMGGNDVTAEPPAYITEPSTDQYGNEVPSRQQLSTEGISGPLARGLDASRRMVGQFDEGDGRERDSLDANKQRVQSQVSQAFNREAYPDLGVQLGADWVRQTLSRNPTPEEYQDAAYARLEELNGRTPEFSQPAKETPRVTETPQAIETKEERQEAPKPTAPTITAPAPVATTVEETKKEEAAPLELAATRNEEIETDEVYVPPIVKTITASEASLPKVPKPRKPGGGRTKSEGAKTEKERNEQSKDIAKFNRDVLTGVKAAKKMEEPTGFFPTTQEYDYAEAVRIRTLEEIRTKLYGLYLSNDIKAGYIAAKNYIRSLKPSELERIKALHEGTAEPHPIPPTPTGMVWVPNANEAGVGGILVPQEDIVDKYEALWESEKEARRSGAVTKEQLFARAIRSAANAYKNKIEKMRIRKFHGEEKKSSKVVAPKPVEVKKTEEVEKKEAEPTGLDWKTESTEEPIPRFTPTEEEEAEFGRLRREEKAPSRSLEQRIKDLGVKVEEEEETSEDEYGETQEDLQDLIEEELDEDDRALLADHYGRDSFDKRAKSEFIADIQLAMREGLEAVSSVLHEIIRRLQAGVLAAVIIMNPDYMSQPMAMAIPMYETKTVQVRAEVPAEAAAKMSEGAKTAYSVIYPAMEQKLKEKNKNFIITDKPTATVFIFGPDGKLVLDNKVLLGLQEGDYFKGDNEIPTNRITPAGLYTMGLRDAARGVTDNGGDEKRTAGHYDFGKVFVLDKAIDGKASVTLFHSVWTKEKDAKQRLAALQKPGAEDSRYSFGCINVAKPVYKYLLDTQQNRMDGAALFVVPENPANTMDFINGKATASKDLVRQKVEPLTTEVKEKVPTTPGEKKATGEAKAIAREEESGALPAGIAFAGALAARRRKKGEKTNEDTIIDKIIDGTLNTAVAKKMNLSDLAALTAQAAQIVAYEHSTESDLTFANINNLSDALIYIQQSGTLLDAGIAAAIYSGDNRKITDNVSLLTINPDTKYGSQFAQEMQGELKGANALYFPSDDFKKGYVLLAHPKYGHNGTNALAVLHEGLHAITYAKIKYVQNMIDMGREKEVPARLMDAYKSLEELMGRAEAAYQNTSGNARLDELASSEAFTDVNEFVSYGLTDTDMKAFLMQIPGTTTKTSGFSSFVNALMQLLGINPKEQSGFKDFVLVTSELIQAKSPSPAKVAASNAEKENLVKYAKKRILTVKEAKERYFATKTPDERRRALGSLLAVARDSSLWMAYIKSNFEKLPLNKLDVMLRASPTDRLYRLAKELGVGVNAINDIKNGIDEKNQFRNRTLRTVDTLARNWSKLKTRDAERLSSVMQISTMSQKDPSLGPTGNASLDATWKLLSPKAKTLYADVRDFYVNNYNLYRALLNQRINNANLSNTSKQMLMDEIKQMYETGAKLAPFFPLMRYGDHWARLGKGDNRIFIMDDSATIRDDYINEFIKEQRKLGDNRSQEQMLADGFINYGDDIQEVMEKEAADSSEIMKKLFTMIDGMAAADKATKESIKKDIFSMHLLAMPEGTFRKQFLPREEIAGFNKDAMRDFIVMGNRFANQLSNLKYGPKIRNGISAAKDSVRTHPNKLRLEKIIRRIEARAEEELNPPEMDNGIEKFTRFATKSAFLWQMTAIKSAVNQMSSIITHGMPTMWKYFGVGNTTVEMLRFAKDGYRQVGITNYDAKGHIINTAPSIGSSALVLSNPDYIKAFNAFAISGQADATRTMDLTGRGKTARESYGAISKLSNAALNTVTFPFHLGERLSREITFMSAFNLAMKKFANEPNHNVRVNKSIAMALEVTKEALFNYDPANTPELMRSAPARIAAQYYKFQVFNIEFLCRNFGEMVSKLPKAERWGAFKAFAGTLGTTVLIGGVRRFFMYSVVMGAIQGLLNFIRYLNDDDDEVPLWELNFKKYFENVWLPETFGEPEINGIPLSEWIANGTLDNLTGYDMASGMSMDFWFADETTSSDWKHALVDTLMNIGGAAVGLAETWASAADDATKNGDYIKALEKGMPSMFKGIFTSLRQKEEGERTGSLQVIKEAKDFTDSQLLMQALLGYKTKALAERQKDVFLIRNERMKLDNLRADIIKQIERSATLDRQDRFDRMIDKAVRFNSMYPNPELAIEFKDIENSFDRRMELIKKNNSGVTMEMKNALLLRLQDKSERNLAKEIEESK